MNKVCITFSNDTDNKDVIFDLLDTSIAQKWFFEISKKYPIYENSRFTGWPGGRTADYYITEIDRCIKIVNEYEPNKITLVGSDDLNHLHKFFEILRGGVLEPNPWFEQAPAQVQEAICRFNVLIHNYEKLLKSKHLSPTVTCTFSDRDRYELDEDDYQHFTYDWKFGTIYINYCEVGKHLLELYVDDDDVIGEHNIRPLKYYSADFKLKFFTDLPRDEFLKFDSKFQSWINDNSELFKKLGFKHLSLGFIPAALINYTDSGFTGLTQEEIIKQLSIYNFISDVKVVV